MYVCIYVCVVPQLRAGVAGVAACRAHHVLAAAGSGSLPVPVWYRQASVAVALTMHVNLCNVPGTQGHSHAAVGTAGPGG